MSNITTPVLTKITEAVMVALFSPAFYGGSAFSPLSLFGASDQGGWWDFDDDMDTKLQWCLDNPAYTNATFLAQFPNHALFQDSAGATAVTAVEQSLGMVKDKSGKGNHRTQATSGFKPKWSARKNLLTQTENFADAMWGLSNATKAPNTAIAPDGSTTACVIAYTAASGHVQSNIASTVGVTYKQSIYIRRKVGTGTINMWNSAGTTTNVTSQISTTWARVELPAVPATGGSVSIFITALTSGDEIEIWHPQIEYGSTATAYQSVVTDTDYNAIGFPKGCKYDGIDDSMATASIDFTATDSMSVSMGVQKTSDSAQGMLLEHTASLASNNGSFYVSAPNSAASNYAFASKGTVSATDIETGFASPHTAVLTGISDISGDSALLRINGVAGTAVTTDQGTGNFANAVLYFGRRGGASLPFTGVEYQTTIINRPFTAGELTNIETFNATKSGVEI